MRELHLHRQLRQLFDQIFPHQRRVPARPARRDHNAVDRPQFRRRHVQPAELRRRPLKIQAPAQRVQNRLRLVVNLLQHEMRVLAPRRVLLVEFQFANLHVRRVRPQVAHLETTRGNRRHIVIVQVHHLLRVCHDGIRIARQIMLVLADADDQRRPPPRPHHQIRAVRANHRQPVRPDHLPQCVHHRRHQRLFPAAATFRVVLADQMRQHFRVRRGFEFVSPLRQPLLQQVVILDHPVVHHRNLAARIRMRMRIFIAWHPMRGPARMANSQGAVHRRSLHQRRQPLVNLAELFADCQHAVPEHRQPRAVIAAVFQPAQAFQKNG